MVTRTAKNAKVKSRKNLSAYGNIFFKTNHAKMQITKHAFKQIKAGRFNSAANWRKYHVKN